MTEADVYAMVLGRTIAELRDRHGLSQVALANKVGLTQPTLSRLEKGATNPELHTLRAIAKAFGLDTPSLIAQAEAAFARTSQAAGGAGTPPAQTEGQWWQMATLGALGVASIVGLAVAAALATTRESDIASNAPLQELARLLVTGGPGTKIEVEYDAGRVVVKSGSLCSVSKREAWDRTLREAVRALPG